MFNEPWPTGTDVLDFLDQSGQPILPQANQVVRMTTAAAMAYTRGRGFEDSATVPAELAAVIITAAARLTTNPQQLARESLGSQTAWYRPAEWTLAERITLDRYRVKAVG